MDKTSLDGGVAGDEQRTPRWMSSLIPSRSPAARSRGRASTARASLDRATASRQKKRLTQISIPECCTGNR